MLEYFTAEQTLLSIHISLAIVWSIVRHLKEREGRQQSTSFSCESAIFLRRGL